MPEDDIGTLHEGKEYDERVLVILTGLGAISDARSFLASARSRCEGDCRRHVPVILTGSGAAGDAFDIPTLSSLLYGNVAMGR